MTDTTTYEFERLTEDEFDARYEPVAAYEDDNSIWEYDQLGTLPVNHVWSVVEVDDDLYVIPGYHVVNMVGYNVTAHPWEHENIEVRLWNPHDDHEHDDEGDCIV